MTCSMTIFSHLLTPYVCPARVAACRYCTQPKVKSGAPSFAVPQSVIHDPEGNAAACGWKLTQASTGVGAEGVDVGDI